MRVVNAAVSALHGKTRLHNLETSLLNWLRIWLHLFASARFKVRSAPTYQKRWSGLRLGLCTPQNQEALCLASAETFIFTWKNSRSITDIQIQSIPYWKYEQITNSIYSSRNKIQHISLQDILNLDIFIKTDMENSSTHTHARITDLFSSKVAWGIRRFAQEDYDLDSPK